MAGDLHSAFVGFLDSCAKLIARYIHVRLERGSAFVCPEINHPPGVVRPGSVNADLVQNLDFAETFLDMAGVKPPADMQGKCLVPLLKDPKAAWEHAALTTHGRNNHAVRTARWRYIRYADGSEELYDRSSDPNEWTNRAADPKLADVKTALAKHLPKTNAPPLPGSAGRILTYDNGVPVWEGKPIGPNDPFPDK